MTKSPIRVSSRVKLFVSKKAEIEGLTEGEIIELELFGVLSNKKRRR